MFYISLLAVFSYNSKARPIIWKMLCRDAHWHTWCFASKAGSARC